MDDGELGEGGRVAGRGEQGVPGRLVPALSLASLSFLYPSLLPSRASETSSSASLPLPCFFLRTPFLHPPEWGGCVSIKCRREALPWGLFLPNKCAVAQKKRLATQIKIRVKGDHKRRGNLDQDPPREARILIKKNGAAH